MEGSRAKVDARGFNSTGSVGTNLPKNRQEPNAGRSEKVVIRGKAKGEKGGGRGRRYKGEGAFDQSRGTQTHELGKWDRTSRKTSRKNRGAAIS